MQLLCVFSLLVALAPGSQAAPAAKTPAPKAAPAAKTAAPKAAAAAAGKSGGTVDLTGGDDMKFSTTKIAAKPGESVHVVLKNVGTVPKIAMAHNFVLLNSTADTNAFVQAAMTARETDYVPAAMKAQVLASTKLAGPGETVDVTFKAPTKPGTYTFLCTFPGHFAAGMKGELVVK
jgi:azurin